MYLQQLIGPKRKDKVRLVAECSVCCDSGISSLSGCKKKGDSFVSSPPGEKDEIKSLACIFFLFRHEKESRLPYFQYGVMGCPGFRPLRLGIKSGCGGKGKNWNEFLTSALNELKAQTAGFLVSHGTGKI